jgi:hypothetical protein
MLAALEQGGREASGWPNAYFAGHRLFSLTAAHALACQSSKTPESRVRETRLQGAEGEGPRLNRPFLPLSRQNASRPGAVSLSPALRS